MLNKYKFIMIVEGEFAELSSVNGLWGESQCNGCHHTILDVIRRLTFISGKLTKRGVNHC